MSYRSNKTRKAMLLAAVAAVSVGSSALAQQQLTFAGPGILPLQSGYGAWNETEPRWYDGSNLLTWSNGNNDGAHFTLPGVVQIPNNVNAQQISVSGGRTYFVNTPAATSTITLSAGTINVAAGSRLDSIAAFAGGSAGLIKEGDGDLVLYATQLASLTTGSVQINGGTLGLGSTTADLPSQMQYFINTGATLDFGYTGGWFDENVGSLSGSGTIRLGSGTPGANDGTTGSILTIEARAGVSTFSGQILGTGARITKRGGGEQILAGSNSFTGRILMSTEQTDFTTPTAVNSILTIANANAVNGNVLLFSHTGGLATSVVNFNQPTTIGLIGMISPGAGTTNGQGGNGTSTINLNGDLTIDMVDFPGLAGRKDQRASYAGVIAGTGNLIKKGNNYQSLITVAQANTFVGTVSIAGGTLIVSGDAKLGNASNPLSLDGGVFSNWISGTGNSSPNLGNRSIFINSDSGLQTLNNAAGLLTTTFNGSVSGSGNLTKFGPGAVAFSNGANSLTGNILVKDGVLTSTASSGTPWGTGSVTFEQGEWRFLPGSTGGGSAVVTAASAAGAKFTYGPGTQIQLNKGTDASNANLTVTLGDSSASSSSLATTGPNSTLTIQPFTGVGGGLGTGTGALGTTEKLIITGGVPMNNGIVSPGIVSHALGGTSGTRLTAGEYLSYDNTNGFVLATYTTGDINGTDNTRVFSQTGNAALTADAAVYALQLGKIGTGTTTVSAGTLSGAFRLTVGDGTGQAGLILNGPSQINTSSLTFSGSEATIYVSEGATAQIGAAVNVTGSNGLTKFGMGALVLNQPASYTGRTVIAHGNVILGVDNALPTGTDLVFQGSAAYLGTNLNNAGLQLGFRNQTVNSLSSENRYTTIDLGTGTLTVAQNTDTVFKGTFFGSGGTLHKTGTGLLNINPFNGGDVSTAAGGPFTTTYGRLRISGGTVEMGHSSGLPANPASLVPGMITLEGGGALRWNDTPLMTSGTTDSLNLGSLRGITLGAGGGVIDVVDAFYTMGLYRGTGESLTTSIRETITGSGDLTKTGLGNLQLGVGNSYTGRTIVKAGRLVFATDDALTPTVTAGNAIGATPASFIADGIILDGGALESSGSGIINPNRGITITANNGTLVAASGFVLNSPITGPGALLRTGAASVHFNAGNSFLGDLTLRNGSTYFNVSNSAGLGAIHLDPKYATTIGKWEGMNDTVLANAIVIDPAPNGGSRLSIRVQPSIGSLILSGPISGSSTLWKDNGGATGTAGQGTLVLSGNNSGFSGDLVVYAGTLVAASANALGTTAGVTAIEQDSSLAFTGNINSNLNEQVYFGGFGYAGLGSIQNIAGDNVYMASLTATSNSWINAQGGSLRVGPVQGASTLTFVGGGTFEAQRYRTKAIEVNAGVTKVTTGLANNAADGVNVVDSISTAGGAMDLTNNAMVVNYTGGSELNNVRAQLSNGYNGGAWNGGVGIRSSSAAAASGPKTAIAYFEASAALGGGGGMYFGQNVDGSAVLLQYVLDADANRDNKVNTLDFNIVAGQFGNAGVTWLEGDFNYDGVVDSTDFGKLVGNYGHNSLPVPPPAPLPASPLGAAVPEPASLSLLAMAAGLLTRRRRSI